MTTIGRCGLVVLTLGAAAQMWGGAAAGEKGQKEEKKEEKKSAVELTDKASLNWLLKKADVEAKVISDRDYIFSRLPEEMVGAAYLLRSSGDWTKWLPHGA